MANKVKVSTISASQSFRINFRKILRQKKYTLAYFAEVVDMDVSKVQRLQDQKQNGAISLDDAEKIASALETTLGYMCDSSYTDYMLQKTLLLREFFKTRSDQWREFKAMTEKKHDMEIEIVDYLEEILTNVDSLNRVD